MPALSARPNAGLVRRAIAGGVLLCLVTHASACKRKASRLQCEALVDRYAQLVVSESYPDASAAQIQAEREREQNEARGYDAFKNCSSEVSQAELECAMGAAKADAFEKCLE